MSDKISLIMEHYTKNGHTEANRATLFNSQLSCLGRFEWTMTPEPYVVQLDPDCNTTLKMYLYKNVQNVEFIRNKIIEGALSCAVIKPSLILDPFQVAAAANRAVVAEKYNTMVTRTVFAEILFNLSLSKNITQSLSKFGIEKDENLLVCFLNKDSVDYSADILPNIDGECCPISDLNKFTNIKDVKNVYKLNNYKGEHILDIVVSRIVTKNIVSY